MQTSFCEGIKRLSRKGPIAKTSPYMTIQFSRLPTQRREVEEEDGDGRMQVCERGHDNLLQLQSSFSGRVWHRYALERLVTDTHIVRNPPSFTRFYLHRNLQSLCSSSACYFTRSTLHHFIRTQVRQTMGALGNPPINHRQSRTFDPVSRAQNIPQTFNSLAKKAALAMRKRVDIIQGITETFQYPSMDDNAHRDDYDTWQIRLQTVDTMLPIELATTWMRRFYVFANEAADSYIGRELDDLENFTLRLGQVTLEVFCRNFLCWNIVKAFLERMEKLTANGFVGMFEGHVVNVATGFTTWVKLTIAPPRPRPE